MFCTQCGQQHPDGSKFCSRCGAAMPAVAAPGAGAPGAGAQPEGGGDEEVTTTSTLSLSAIEGALGHESGDPDSGSVEAVPAGSALLVVKRGPNAGSRFLLDAGTTTAGRHPESDIFLDDVTVSRRHAEFVRSDDGFTVRDVGSLNGTYLNRERIEAASLSSGDEVQIGKYRMVFLVGGGQ